MSNLGRFTRETERQPLVLPIKRFPAPDKERINPSRREEPVLQPQKKPEKVGAK